MSQPDAASCALPRPSSQSAAEDCLPGQRGLALEVVEVAVRQLGERLPSYCKLAAVAEAFARGYAEAVFLDSDAFLQNVSPGVPALRATDSIRLVAWSAMIEPWV